MLIFYMISTNTKQPTCIILDEMHESLEGLLSEAGYEPVFALTISRDELMKEIGHHEGIIVRSKLTLDRELIAAASKLKFIARAGAGIDKIDQEAAAEFGIPILNAPEGNRDAVGEHATGALLALLNKMHTSDLEVRNKQWRREANRGTEIMGKTIGLIGFGYMGQAFARRLTGFGVRVLAYDKYKKNYANEFAAASSLEQLKEEADIVSFHVPLTRETRELYDYTFFNEFAKPLVVVNTARGKILKLADLITLMDEGKVLAAALDVLENEKPYSLQGEELKIFNNLTARNNILFTPHVGGWTHESYRKINEVLVNKIKALKTV